MLLRVNKIFIFFFISTILSVGASAQITGKFVIGGFGNMGSTEMIHSAPAIIESEKCLEVSNGLKVLFNSKPGNFTLTCPETQKLDLQVLAYPIPVTDYLNVKVLNSQNLATNEQYFLHVTDFTGKVVQIVKTDFSSLISGARIPVSNLLQGNYIVSLLSSTARLQSIKFIKNTK
ncbi:T9SS type A sorting domain-containing protein [Sediminibacterium sp.]|uniref:T9SS type A sorting domain-containing protein n=1 Tax=Sediminibacterium sp. TaxID=1917865 RepID=UPI0027352596|nr:T9SS type A sorting domain-containing protein [Sediminibacterium sp.]MDP3392727.1 T9SS type A sorting domain-containing protein [Sediminibacterium sp.]MDP3565849.1 T9SS type A sorting domain-containing protein [Sediminibacterium sp.]